MKISPNKLLEKVVSCLKRYDGFTVIKGGMPFLISWNGEKIYLYVKTLSSAYFKNANITRVQLPQKEIFSRIKKTNIKFVFLGYDPENDVFVAWDCNIVKSRLNQNSNVSFYSRADSQLQSAQGRSFVRFSLDNGDEVVAFKSALLRHFLDKADKLFHRNMKETSKALVDDFKIDKELKKEIDPMLKGTAVRMLDALQAMMQYYNSKNIQKSVKECSEALLDYMKSIQNPEKSGNMRRKVDGSITDKQFTDAFTAAGGWFFLTQYQLIASSQLSRRELLKLLFEKGFDTEMSGTETRLYGVKKIIQGGRSREALEKIRDSKKINKAHPQAKAMAEEILATL